MGNSEVRRLFAIVSNKKGRAGHLRVVPGKPFWTALHTSQARLQCHSLWALDEALRPLPQLGELELVPQPGSRQVVLSSVVSGWYLLFTATDPPGPDWLLGYGASSLPCNPFGPCEAARRAGPAFPVGSSNHPDWPVVVCFRLIGKCVCVS